MSGLYIHIPYCHSKCAYCDFFSTPNVKSLEQYVDALLIEFKTRISGFRGAISTIYIGGGTPSIVPIYLLKRIIDEIREYIDLSTIEEFTIEANPEDISNDWVRSIVELGVNRVSMGIQSFSDIELKAINRRHTSAEALNALKIIRQGGITLISGDLIYGLPKQSFESWRNSLDTLLQLRLPHFSSYLLSFEPGTGLYARLMSGKVTEASEELVNEMYNYLISAAKLCGYNHYEISNFALPGYEAIHNSNYWRDLPYLGLGVSAHSFDGKQRSFNPSNIKEYIYSMSNKKNFSVVEIEDINSRHNDYVIVSLRTLHGIDVDKYKDRFGLKLYNRLMSLAESHIKVGRMSLRNNNLSINEDSMLISDSIMLDFII